MNTAVSAPGKVLLAGGYLVLDRAYTGLVFGLSARIHVVVQDVEKSLDPQLSQIVVQSPQFRDAEWTYSYELVDGRDGVSVQGYEDCSFHHQSPSISPNALSTHRLTSLFYHPYTSRVFS